MRQSHCNWVVAILLAVVGAPGCAERQDVPGATTPAGGEKAPLGADPEDQGGFPGANTPAREKKIPLYEYLDRAGVKLDCYFTIEQLPLKYDNWITMYEVQEGEDISTIEQLVAHLSALLKGVHVYRSDENPAVVHLVDARLEKEKEYPLAERVSVNYSGSIQELVDRLNQMYFEDLHSKKCFSVGGWPGLCVDYSTMVNCSARDAPVRRILSDCVPLSQYERIMWIADIGNEGGKLDVSIQYLGAAPRPLRIFLWKDKITFEQHYLGEPTVNGLFRFETGEVAYANNRDDLRTNPSDDLDEKAIAFTRERMKAGNTLQVRWAMLFLGKRKAEAGIPVLLKHIDYQYTTCGVLEESYPAVRALTQIGQPAADAAFKELLDQDTSDLRVGLLYAVVRAVNGYLPTRELVEKGLADATDAKQKKRLELALKLLKDEE